MKESNYDRQPLIERLEKLKNDRGAMAALRRGLGQPPGSMPEMYPYIVPMLPANPYKDLEDTYYLVASLFAFHPQCVSSGNLGDHFRQAVNQEQGNSEAIERRFKALLGAHPDDLPFFLRQAVSFLRSKNIAIHWDELVKNLMHWGSPRRSVQRAWAKSFWGIEASANENTKEN
jgi:CRISPR system Cascade subunit CasB